MTQPAILVIDVGTTVLKTGLFDFRCQPVARCPRPHGIEGLNPADSAERLWAILKQSVTALIHHNPDHQVAAVGLTGFMHYVFPLDADGTVLPLVATPADTRACFDEMLDHFGSEQIYRTTGSRLDVTSVPTHVLAWGMRCPRESEKIDRLLPVKDLLRYRLTRETATDEIDACGTMFYDVRMRGWDAATLSHCGLDPESLPCVRHCTETGGAVSAGAANELGLRPGIPVAVGGGDDIEILGSGASKPGQVCEHVGSTGSFLLPLLKPEADPHQRLELYPSVARGGWVLGGSCSNVSRALDWFLATSAYGSAGYDRVRRNLAGTLSEFNSHRPLFLPYLYGERAPLWNPDLNAQWIGLRSSHTDSDLLVSVVEGICFSLRSVLEVYKDLGLDADVVYSSGGFNELGAHRLRATIYGIPIRLVRGIDPTSFAAAAITLCSLGELRDPYEAVGWLGFEPEVEPEPAWQAVLEERFASFLDYTRRVQLSPWTPQPAADPGLPRSRERTAPC